MGDKGDSQVSIKSLEAFSLKVPRCGIGSGSIVSELFLLRAQARAAARASIKTYDLNIFLTRRFQDASIDVR